MSPNTQPVLSTALRYSGIQPQYFPRLHYFNRILNTDVFMVRDEVQFVGKHKYPEGHNGPSYQAHTSIKIDSGTYLLNVAIEHAGQKRLIYQTKTTPDSSWREKHLKTIRYAYAKAPYFDIIYSQLEKIISKNHQSLAELNLKTILWVIGRLTESDEVLDSTVTFKSIDSLLKKQPFFRLKSIKLASQSQFYANSGQASANEKIIGLIKEVGATEDFCGGTAVAAYMDDKLFDQHDIKTVVQDWKCPEYPQQFMKKNGFAPNLSIIDLLMNVSTDEARSILKG